MNEIGKAGSTSGFITVPTGIGVCTSKQNTAKVFETKRIRSVIPLDIQAKLNRAVVMMRELVLQAGDVMKRYRQGEIKFILKPDGSKVTEADIEIQKFIIDRIRKEFPNSGIIAEETLEGKNYSTNNVTPALGLNFVIDPIDGTGRFIELGDKNFGCAIALMYNGEVIAATFYAPEYEINSHSSDKYSGSLFEASELCDGMFLNGKPVCMDAKKTNFNNHTAVLEDVQEHGLNLDSLKVIHANGSDVLTLSLVSSGLKDTPIVLANGGWDGSPGAYLWDVVAGAYFIEKAGGVAWNRHGDNFFPLTNIALHKGKPVYNGEYFTGYPNAIKQLLGV